MPSTWLDELDLSHAIQGWETPKARRSVTGAALAIAGRTFERGVGTHTVGSLCVRLDGRAVRFTALVGVDDAVGRHGWGKARFVVIGDGRVLCDSGVVAGGESARAVGCDLHGVRRLELRSDAPGDNTHHGHADWCDARIDWDGVPPEAAPRPRGEAAVLTPAEGAAPRLVAGWVAACRPGTPFLHTIACAGERPMRFAAEGLPPGLRLDEERGVIAGIAGFPARHAIRISARNAHGVDRRVLTLVVGDTLAPTPPMGWSSWNCRGHRLDQAAVRANADALVAQGLHRYGYAYVNTDDGWQGTRSAAGAIPWALQPNAGFPDPAGLAAHIHGLGLRAGIYSVPNIYSPQGLCGGSAEHPDGRVDTPFAHGAHKPVGAYRYFREDIAQYAAWGFDYLKMDNCPSVEICAELDHAIRACGRGIVLSLSAGMPRDLIPQYGRHAQLWRTTGDLIDTWFSVRDKLRAQVAWQGLGGPGGWNDPDMLVVGAVGPGWNAPQQPSRLAYVEQHLHVGMWAFLAAPLMIGGELTVLDPFTRALLTNPEVIEIDQDPLGAPARLIDQDAERGAMRWRRELAGGDVAVALVALGDEDMELGVDLDELGLDGAWIARDVWRCADIERVRGGIRVAVPAHGMRLLRLRRAEARP